MDINAIEAMIRSKYALSDTHGVAVVLANAQGGKTFDTTTIFDVVWEDFEGLKKSQIQVTMTTPVTVEDVITANNNRQNITQAFAALYDTFITEAGAAKQRGKAIQELNALCKKMGYNDLIRYKS